MNQFKKKIGLSLAKFAPFHIGHESLIKTALREVDELIIIIYDCPDITTIPLNVRANWVRKLYPKVKVIEGWDAPNRHEDTDEVKRMQEEYVIRKLKGKKIDYFFSSEHYGDHMSKALGAVNRVLDLERKEIRISGSKIRRNVYENRHFLNKLVYKDLLTKVAFISIPSKVHRKIASNVANRIGSVFIKDILLDFINSKLKKPHTINFLKKINFKEIAKIRNNNLSNDDAILRANKTLIYESAPIMDHVLSLQIKENFDPVLSAMANTSLSEYDVIFVCNIKNNKHDNIFALNEKALMNQIIGNLKANRVNHILLEGDFNKITSAAVRYLKKNHSIQKV